MTDPKWMNLQLFAEGGEGAAGDGGGESAPGVEADPGRQRLLALGVPADKIRERASKAAAKVSPVATGEQEQQPKQDAAAQQEQPTEGQEKPAKATWDELMKDPDYNREMQKTVNARLRTAKSAEANLAALAPALDIFVKRYGLDPANLDHKDLAEKIRSDDSLWDQKATELGTENSIARRLGLAEIDDERQQRTQRDTMRQQMMADHRAKLDQQVPKMQEMFPGFDLDKELDNPTFARLVGPGNVLNLEQAYRAIHYEEIAAAQAAATAQQVAQQVAQTVRANARRPVEAGASGAPSVISFNWKNASKDQRAALKQRILEADARGEKVYPTG